MKERAGGPAEVSFWISFPSSLAVKDLCYQRNNKKIGPFVIYSLDWI